MLPRHEPMRFRRIAILWGILLSFVVVLPYGFLTDLLGQTLSLSGYFLNLAALYGILSGSTVQSIQRASFYWSCPGLHRTLGQRTLAIGFFIALLLTGIAFWYDVQTLGGAALSRPVSYWLMLGGLFLFCFLLGTVLPDPRSSTRTVVNLLALLALLALQPYLLAASENHPFSGPLLTFAGIGLLYRYRFSRNSAREIQRRSRRALFLADFQPKASSKRPAIRIFRRYSPRERIRSAEEWAKAAVYEHQSRWLRSQPVMKKLTWFFIFGLTVFFFEEGLRGLANFYSMAVIFVLPGIPIPPVLRMTVLYPISRQQRVEIGTHFARRLSRYLIWIPFGILWLGCVLRSIVTGNAAPFDLVISTAANVTSVQCVITAGALLMFFAAPPTRPLKQLSNHRRLKYVYWAAGFALVGSSAFMLSSSFFGGIRDAFRSIEPAARFLVLVSVFLFARWASSSLFRQSLAVKWILERDLV